MSNERDLLSACEQIESIRSHQRRHGEQWRRGGERERRRDDGPFGLLEKRALDQRNYSSTLQRITHRHLPPRLLVESGWSGFLISLLGLSVCWRACLFVCLFVCLFACLFVCLRACLFFVWLLCACGWYCGHVACRVKCGCCL